MDAARERAESAITRARATPHRRDARILVGTASWTDPTLTAGEVFYPQGTTSAEDRLRFYAGRFPLVEVDSTYYALPARRMAELWVERTPHDFVFDIKAHALMTGHPTEVKRLPRILRDALPSQLATAERVYAKDLPPEVEEAVWAIFLDALEPLREAGKLGAVLLQYPRWFIPNRDNAGAIVRAGERLRGLLAAVEFRNRRWLEGRTAERTLGLLREHGLPLVMVDGPQGEEEESVPPVTATTSPELAIVRLHGRRPDTWTRRAPSVAEKYRYLYDGAELDEVVARVQSAAQGVRQTHVVLNNCYGNYGTTNAAELMAKLGAAP
jgi:uncharacterized protein YecE (DUF72 family)